MSTLFKHVLMGDTDSAYVRLDLYAERMGIERNRENMTTLADALQKRLEDDLPEILGRKFVTDPENIKILEPGRETVGRKALFKDKKKRYAIHVIDDEGFPADKLKVMGMEVRRSDTPAHIQEFLLEGLKRVVQHDATFDDLLEYVQEFRANFRNMDPWRQGSPGRVKNLAKATRAFDAWCDKIENGKVGEKLPQMHVTVKAALSTNRLIKHFDDHRWDLIRDGDKVEVIYLKDNPFQLDCVAIKTGETYVPDWFKELPFDSARMEEKLIDKKLFNVIGDILGWDFTPPKTFADELFDRDDDFYD